MFKAKRVDNGEWIEGFYFKRINPHTEDGSPIVHCISDIPPFGADVIQKTVCQFTGLYDKNGNRIWENDIVKTKFGRLCKVVWRQTQCFVGWDFDVCDFDFGVNRFSKPPSSWDLYFSENLEVIGNSIDNHELLTAERNE